MPDTNRVLVLGKRVAAGSATVICMAAADITCDSLQAPVSLDCLRANYEYRIEVNTMTTIKGFG
ncbi:hypothetical protein BG005_000775 [Podila minutissima]|nr:hypothetical protein BG005_000775 [Podila minutissima]